MQVEFVDSVVLVLVISGGDEKRTPGVDGFGSVWTIRVVGGFGE